MKQIYEFKLFMECEPDKEQTPSDWLHEALTQDSIWITNNQVYGIDATPINIDEPGFEWLKMIKNDKDSKK